MPRVKKGAPRRRQARKRILKAARGRRGAPGHLYRLAKEALVHGGVYAHRDRRRRKREFRGLWIVRMSAACRQRGIKYSEFINGCKKAGIALNRKMLSEIAIADPAGFDAVAESVKQAIAR